MFGVDHRRRLRNVFRTGRRRYIESKLKEGDVGTLRNFVYLIDHTDGEGRVLLSILNAHIHTWFGYLDGSSKIESYDDFLDALARKADRVFFKSQFQYKVKQMSVIGFYLPAGAEPSTETRGRIEEYALGVNDNMGFKTIEVVEGPGVFEPDDERLRISSDQFIGKMREYLSYIDIPFSLHFYKSVTSRLKKAGFHADNRNS